MNQCPPGWPVASPSNICTTAMAKQMVLVWLLWTWLQGVEVKIMTLSWITSLHGQKDTQVVFFAVASLPVQIKKGSWRNVVPWSPIRFLTLLCSVWQRLKAWTTTREDWFVVVIGQNNLPFRFPRCCEKGPQRPLQETITDKLWVLLRGRLPMIYSSSSVHCMNTSFS